MAASVAVLPTSAARGSAINVQAAGFKPGRTVVLYVKGQFMGVQATGPYGQGGPTAAPTDPGFGATDTQLTVPTAGSNPGQLPGTGADLVVAVDNTDFTTSTTATLTVS